MAAMSKQELLVKLATKCKLWGEAVNLTKLITVRQGHPFDGPSLTKNQWPSERKRLINKPSWKSAPVEATHLACDESGRWVFYKRDSGFWLEVSDYPASQAVVLPAGFDWSTSLEARRV